MPGFNDVLVEWLLGGNVNPTGSQDRGLQVSRGDFEGEYAVLKFGQAPSVGATITPVTSAKTYQTPTSAQTLEILGVAADNPSGAGARKVIVQGLNASGVQIEEEVTMNGATPVTLSNQFLRVYRMWVSESGTYATSTAPSHTGNITLRASGGGDTWALITNEGGFGIGQSEIAVYTVPAGKKAYLYRASAEVEANKTADVYLFKRENIDDTTAPYSAMRVQHRWLGLTQGSHTLLKAQLPQEFPALTDIGFMASMATSGDISIYFELHIMDA